MFLTTQRLYLTKLTTKHLPNLLELFTDKDVMQFSLNGIEDLAYCKQYLTYQQQLYKKNLGSFAVYDNKQQFIGCIGLMPVNIDYQPEIELGYRLKPSYWHQGLATEAAIALKLYAFNTLNLTTIIAIIHKENLASINVAKKTGFVFEKHALFYNTLIQIFRTA